MNRALLIEAAFVLGLAACSPTEIQSRLPFQNEASASSSPSAKPSLSPVATLTPIEEYRVNFMNGFYDDSELVKWVDQQTKLGFVIKIHHYNSPILVNVTSRIGLNVRSIPDKKGLALEPA